MILSKYAFADLLIDGTDSFFPGDRGADPARIAAQIVSGLGFLGAGVIFKHGSSIRGLTTAAGLWATAAVGMAFGSGLYSVGIFTTFLLLFFQLFQLFALKIKGENCGNYINYVERFIIVSQKAENFYDILTQHFGNKIMVTDESVVRNENNTVTCCLTVRTCDKLDTSGLLCELSEKENIVSVSVSEE